MGSGIIELFKKSFSYCFPRRGELVGSWRSVTGDTAFKATHLYKYQDVCMSILANIEQQLTNILLYLVRYQRLLSAVMRMCTCPKSHVLSKTSKILWIWPSMLLHVFYCSPAAYHLPRYWHWYGRTAIGPILAAVEARGAYFANKLFFSTSPLNFC